MKLFHSPSQFLTKLLSVWLILWLSVIKQRGRDLTILIFIFSLEEYSCRAKKEGLRIILWKKKIEEIYCWNFINHWFWELIACWKRCRSILVENKIVREERKKAGTNKKSLPCSRKKTNSVVGGVVYEKSKYLTTDLYATGLW